MDMIYWDHYYSGILLVNLLIVMGLFISLRLFSGTIAHINASDELLKKDNPAFGISLAGATFAVTIMLSGSMYGSLVDDLPHAILTVALYGFLGIALMAITRVVFDKIVLPEVSLRDEIVKGNIAVAIADAGNVLAAALIIRAVMVWVPINSLETITTLLCGFALSQFILTSMTILRIKIFGKINKGNCLQSEFKNKNIALALRFAGQKIGAAYALTTASRLVVYEEYDTAPILVAWFFGSIAVIIIWKILCFVAERVILFRVSIYQEIIDQKNIAVGALTAVIFISMGMLISAL